MKKGVILTSIVLSCVAAFWMSIPVGCANIIPPAGGPRDSTPPVLVHVTPPDSSTNFRASRIVMTFDEYVDLQDVQNNLLFTPTFERNPEIAVRAKTITVRFRDSLEANTTYILNFGNAIKDINEGNVMKDFTYTFSTGTYLDTLEYTGRVVLAENGRVDSTMIVMLHRSLDDSAVVKNRPQYITRLDAQGRFRFHNLPAGTFAIYALGDAGLGRRYINKNQLFAFADTSITVGKDSSITLYAYREAEKPVPPPPATKASGSDKRLIFTTSLVNNQQDLLGNLVISFTTPLRVFDSTKLGLATDSTFTPTPFTARLDTSKKQVQLATAWKPGTQYHLLLDKNFAEDTLGRRLLKPDTLSFATRKQSDYGNLSLTIRNIDSTLNPVLQFIQNDIVVLSVPFKTGSYKNSMFTPGEYDLRIVFDTNGDGVWTPGSFFGTKRQPERVKVIDRKITVKPDWDNEFDL